MVKIINQETLVEERVKKLNATKIDIFKGSAKDNLSALKAECFGESMIVPMKNNSWVDSAGYFKLWDEIGHIKKNAANAPSSSELEALLGKYFIDITRRLQEMPDLTSKICTELTNLDFPEVVTPKYLYPYVGKMETMYGNNDSVPLIEQRLGNTDSITLGIKGIGWKDSLKNLLFNSIFEMQKVSDAVARADADARNAAVIGAIVAYAFNTGTGTPKHYQAAVSTAGLTLDEKTYETVMNAIKKLRALTDPQSGQKITPTRMALLVNSADTWQLERVINGQLDINGAAGARGYNRQALPVAEIIEYDGGFNNGLTWNKETLSFPGVTAGYAYLFVPQAYAFVLNKRPLTMETGRGSVLQLSTEERAWYRIQGEYLTDFFGNASADGSVTGTGAIVKIALPS